MPAAKKETRPKITTKAVVRNAFAAYGTRAGAKTITAVQKILQEKAVRIIYLALRFCLAENRVTLTEDDIIRARKADRNESVVYNPIQNNQPYHKRSSYAQLRAEIIAHNSA